MTSFVSCDRLVCSSPSGRKLCTVEKGVKGTEGQLCHGLCNRLLWVDEHFRK